MIRNTTNNSTFAKDGGSCPQAQSLLSSQKLKNTIAGKRSPDRNLLSARLMTCYIENQQLSTFSRQRRDDKCSGTPRRPGTSAYFLIFPSLVPGATAGLVSLAAKYQKNNRW